MSCDFSLCASVAFAFNAELAPVHFSGASLQCFAVFAYSQMFGRRDEIWDPPSTLHIHFTSLCALALKLGQKSSSARYRQTHKQNNTPPVCGANQRLARRAANLLHARLTLAVASLAPLACRLPAPIAICTHEHKSARLLPLLLPPL